VGHLFLLKVFKLYYIQKAVQINYIDDDHGTKVMQFESDTEFPDCWDLKQVSTILIYIYW